MARFPLLSKQILPLAQDIWWDGFLEIWERADRDHNKKTRDKDKRDERSRRIDIENSAHWMDGGGGGFAPDVGGE